MRGQDGYRGLSELRRPAAIFDPGYRRTHHRIDELQDQQVLPIFDFPRRRSPAASGAANAFPRHSQRRPVGPGGIGDGRGNGQCIRIGAERADFVQASESARRRIGFAESSEQVERSGAIHDRDNAQQVDTAGRAAVLDSLAGRYDARYTPHPDRRTAGSALACGACCLDDGLRAIFSWPFYVVRSGSRCAAGSKSDAIVIDDQSTSYGRQQTKPRARA